MMFRPAEKALLALTAHHCNLMYLDDIVVLLTLHACSLPLTRMFLFILLVSNNAA